MIRVAINGFGRIGRLAARLMLEGNDFDLVAVNTSKKAEQLAYLLKYDTTQGSFKVDEISFTDDAIVVGDKHIKVSNEREPEACPWKELNIDLVLECTGKFVEKTEAEKHLAAGAKKVLISAPGKGDMKTVVYNVNHEIITKEDHIVSGASCTTNCLAPLAKVINDEFGIEQGIMTTIHAVTGNQNILDNSHKKGINSRRGRAAGGNIVPTSTGAAKAVGLVLPELNGKLNGMAMRVPTLTGSVVDLVVNLKKKVSIDEINAAVKAKANESFGYTEDPIVSSDVIGSKKGGIFDALATSMVEVDGNQLIKLIAWYDNEMSYTAQLMRTAKLMGELI